MEQVVESKNSLQESFDNTFEINNPTFWLQRIVVPGISGASTNVIGGCDGSNFVGGRTLKSFPVKSTSEHLACCFDTSENQELGEDQSALTIKVAAASIALDACLDTSWIC
jgi:hypothetical protein